MAVHTNDLNVYKSYSPLPHFHPTPLPDPFPPLPMSSGLLPSIVYPFGWGGGGLYQVLLCHISHAPHSPRIRCDGAALLRTQIRYVYLCVWYLYIHTNIHIVSREREDRTKRELSSTHDTTSSVSPSSPLPPSAFSYFVSPLLSRRVPEPCAAVAPPLCLRSTRTHEVCHNQINL
jgi:hypothetical protein